MFLQDFPYLGVGIIEIAKDHGLAVAAGLNTGRQLAILDPFRTKGAFFDG